MPSSVSVVNVPPLLEEAIISIGMELVKASKLPITSANVMSSLRERKFAMNPSTGRLVSYFLSNTDVAGLVAEAIVEENERATSGNKRSTSATSSGEDADTAENSSGNDGSNTDGGETAKLPSSLADKSPAAKRARLTTSGTPAAVLAMIENSMGVKGSSGGGKAGNPSSANTPSSASASAFLSPTRPTLRLSHLAGIENIIQRIRELIFHPIYLRPLYNFINVLPTATVLLHGPSGCGKTSLAMAIAGELGLPFYRVSAPELVGSMSGESEQRIRQLFSQACNGTTTTTTAAAATATTVGSNSTSTEGVVSETSRDPALSADATVLFIDNLDVLASSKESGSGRGMERRIMATLAECIDTVINVSKQAEGLQKTSGADEAADMEEEVDDENTPPKRSKIVILIAATNKAESIDPAIRGRFASEIALPVPDCAARTKILKFFCETVNYERGDDNIADDIAASAALPELDPLAPLPTAVNFDVLGQRTVGYVGADLKVLVEAAGLAAVQRIVAENGGERAVLSQIYGRSVSSVFELNNDAQSSLSASTSASAATPNAEDAVVTTPLTRQNCTVKMVDFMKAMKGIVPTAKREGFAVVPDVAFADVGALEEIQSSLYENIVFPIQQPDVYARYGLADDTTGVLLFGPPGCGKTLLAKAVANECGANFISVKGPELLKSLVGESERSVREVFQRARQSTPCVIFFDEIDSLVPKRGSGFGDNSVADRVVAQFLTELDGVEGRKGVYVVGATNRLDMIDDAILRAKRFGTQLYVPLPHVEERVAILKALTRKTNRNIAYSSDVDLDAIGRDPRCDGFSGADLSNLLREAAMVAIREFRTSMMKKRLQMKQEQSEKASATEEAVAQAADSEGQSSKGSGSSSNPNQITPSHFESAFRNAKASVPHDERMRFNLVRDLVSAPHNKHPLEALRIAKERMEQYHHKQARSAGKMAAQAATPGAGSNSEASGSTPAAKC